MTKTKYFIPQPGDTIERFPKLHGPASKYQDKNLIDYRQVFILHLPMGGAWTLDDETQCAMCDAVIHPNDTGCVKCLECTKEHTDD